MSYQLAEKELILPISQHVVVIREGDGFATKLLLKRGKRGSETIYDYLASFIVSLDGLEKITARGLKDLLVPDNEYLAVECHRFNYGERFEFGLTCPYCSELTQNAINWGTVEYLPLSTESSGPPDPIVTITLPRTGSIVEVGMLDGHKEAILLNQESSSGIDLNQGDYLSLRSIDGSKSFSYEQVLKLPLADHYEIRKARKQLICGYDTRVIVLCPSCGERTRVNLLMHRDFLAPGAGI